MYKVYSRSEDILEIIFILYSRRLPVLPLPLQLVLHLLLGRLLPEEWHGARRVRHLRHFLRCASLLVRGARLS